MTPSASGAGCGPVRRSGGAAVQAVLGPRPSREAGAEARPAGRAHSRPGQEAPVTGRGKPLALLTQQKLSRDSEAASQCPQR